MPVDPKLLEILCCPVSKTPLQQLDAERLNRLNAAITAGEALFVNGSKVDKPLTDALVTEDMKVIYPVEDNIPILLEENAIGTLQFKDF